MTDSTIAIGLLESEIMLQRQHFINVRDKVKEIANSERADADKVVLIEHFVASYINRHCLNPLPPLEDTP